MIQRFRDYSIKTQLISIMLLTSGFVLALATMSFFLSDAISLRKGIKQNLDILANIIGSNTTAAIMFNDQKSARDTLEGLAIDRAGLERVADGMDKYSLPTPAAAIRRALPLTRLYVLSDQPASAATFAPLTGAAAMSAVIGNIYRWPLAQAMGMAKAQFDACVALLGRCAVFELAAPRGLSGLDAIAEAVERHALGAARLGDDLPLALEGL